METKTTCNGKYSKQSVSKMTRVNNPYFSSGIDAIRSLRKTRFVRHFASLLLALILGLSFWLGTTVPITGQSFFTRGGKLASDGSGVASVASFASGSEDGCLVSNGAYRGVAYFSPGGKTLATRCLVESPWMRLAQHTVQLTPDAAPIEDWLWIDYHDRINVLVESPAAGAGNNDEPSFMILRQTKYALESKSSLAVVGGIIEPGEEARVAAERETQEELNVRCETWRSLGRFRTDVNRGMGWVHPFLASNCSYASDDAGKSVAVSEKVTEEVGKKDAEKQNVISMKLSQVRHAVLQGEFVEVQWSNTVSLAMLFLSAP